MWTYEDDVHLLGTTRHGAGVYREHGHFWANVFCLGRLHSIGPFVSLEVAKGAAEFELCTMMKMYDQD